MLGMSLYAHPFIKLCFLRPRQLQSSLIGWMADATVSLFWPSQYFEREFRWCKNNHWVECSFNRPCKPTLRKANSESSIGHKGRNMTTLEIRQNFAEVGNQAGSWWIGYRQGAYVAVYCNKATFWDTSERKDAMVQYESEDEATPCGVS